MRLGYCLTLHLSTVDQYRFNEAEAHAPRIQRNCPHVLYGEAWLQ